MDVIFFGERARHPSPRSIFLMVPLVPQPPLQKYGRQDFQKHPTEYPKLIKAEANNKLKITISGFVEYLMKTRFYESMSLDFH